MKKVSPCHGCDNESNDKNLSPCSECRLPGMYATEIDLAGGFMNPAKYSWIKPEPTEEGEYFASPQKTYSKSWVRLLRDEELSEQQQFEMLVPSINMGVPT